MKRTRLDSVRENLRLQQVYNVFLRYGWDLAFQRWRLLGSMRHSMQRWVWQLPEDVPQLTTGWNSWIPWISLNCGQQVAWTGRRSGVGPGRIARPSSPGPARRTVHSAGPTPATPRSRPSECR